MKTESIHRCPPPPKQFQEASGFHTNCQRDFSKSHMVHLPVNSQVPSGQVHIPEPDTQSPHNEPTASFPPRGANPHHHPARSPTPYTLRQGTQQVINTQEGHSALALGKRTSSAKIDVPTLLGSTCAEPGGDPRDREASCQTAVSQRGPGLGM